MDELRTEQIEALGALAEYSVKLVKCLKICVEELTGEKKEDTYEFLRKTLDGVNWDLQVMNGCMSLINEKETVVDKDSVNAFILKLNDAYAAKNDAGIAEILKKDVIPLIEKLMKVAESYQ